ICWTQAVWILKMKSPTTGFVRLTGGSDAWKMPNMRRRFFVPCGIHTHPCERCTNKSSNGLSVNRLWTPTSPSRRPVSPDIDKSAPGVIHTLPDSRQQISSSALGVRQSGRGYLKDGGAQIGHK